MAAISSAALWRSSSSAKRSRFVLRPPHVAQTELLGEPAAPGPYRIGPPGHWAPMPPLSGRCSAGDREEAAFTRSRNLLSGTGASTREITVTATATAPTMPSRLPAKLENR